ncbi:Rne/Rng family ribonuclease [Bacillus xiapuensis]|uniref:Rne/Rng family ribonuclease n=1 Tax=Bacillus xiapuensis TaxID=2014075 RepID=UPI000C242E05|nr:Rne/Rng family ribonuclease [Bacillus xiapuensis]
MHTLIVSAKAREKRLAVVENGRLEQLHIFQPSHLSRVGFTYYGVITKVEKGMNACFVNIGLEQNGYLHRDQIPGHGGRPIGEVVHQGQKIIVQVIKDETDTKGPRLSAIIEWPGEWLVYLPEGGYTALSKKVAQQEKRQRLADWASQHKRGEEGLIVRTAAFEVPEERLLSEWNELRKQHKQLLKKASAAKAPALLMEKPLLKEEAFARMQALKTGELICDSSEFLSELRADWRYQEEQWPASFHSAAEDIFSANGLEGQAEKALKRIVWLPSGGFLVIEKTEAMTVMDVNTGKFTGKSSQAQTVLLTNKEAAREAARQLRLRDISGIIIIDFIDMFSDKDRREIERLMKSEAKKDPKSMTVREFTSLGLMQITRKKTKSSLLETLTVPCAVCRGNGRVKSAETMAFELERKLLEYARDEHEAILLEVTADVKAVFAGEQNEYHQQLERLLHKRILYRLINGPVPVGNIIRAGTADELSNQ